MNILLLTNIYPNNDPSYGGTAVCHSFTKEWKAMGYNVRVIHFDSLFPKPYYCVGKLFADKIRARTGTVAYIKTPRRPVSYDVDGIPVDFVPLKKWVPHTSPSKRQINGAFEYLCDKMDREDFVPDAITAHFVLPQLEFLHLLKQKYPAAKSCLVLHGNSAALQQTYPEKYRDYMKSVDVWGFRSMAFQMDFEKHFGTYPEEFLCYSGIPEKYLEPVERDFSGGVKRFAYVGSLYELKNVDITLRALKEAMADRKYTFDIVGAGAEFGYLNYLVDKLGMRSHVIFHGQKTRDEAQRIVRNADCFVMVSSSEAFGLVYVEAMAKGCIVIGSKGQGIDGIVKHGDNGFLCKSRDVVALADIFRDITEMSPADLKEISCKAVATATELTDRKVAEKYVKAITIRDNGYKTKNLQ
ncbi:MAG: glycosyltransferase [Candidatus Cryptobacteroides sp.]|jgi:glycosyltransferase involved in cell wall biosynthesis